MALWMPSGGALSQGGLSRDAQARYALQKFGPPKQMPSTKSPFATKGVTRSVHEMLSRDPMYKMGRFAMKGRGGPSRAGGIPGRVSSGGVAVKRGIKKGINLTRRTKQVGRGLLKTIPGPIRRIGRAGGKIGIGSMFVMGAAAMLGVGMMRGAMSAAEDIQAERYMQDQRFARGMLMNTRVGYSMSSGRGNRYGQTAGLAQALNAGRHGR